MPHLGNQYKANCGCNRLRRVQFCMDVSGIFLIYLQESDESSLGTIFRLGCFFGPYLSVTNMSYLDDIATRSIFVGLPSFFHKVLGSGGPSVSRFTVTCERTVVSGFTCRLLFLITFWRSGIKRSAKSWTM
ncbi:hypothetical protein CSKR_202085 [Clonorchis sinensis]|uniref:Uncharacterized protein n=1 Tax=Clonorchis sinensis TaxID=79923 RepID=A0A8T1LWE1_CLOSI|nr:hypothetical protein CSKR_202085 [Clonorchis sinensis]